ncbi:MAG: PDZ domain-containing protein [Proteobacteria bacterium]|nr:PDZ domain-containing protein [Pseudomonadota bacterium]MBU1737974.1 PDZ domain-containing protein [Pseudomonadota bacterium]
MVTVPGVEQKLFGVLFLGKAHVNATGPASRSYQIQIPDSYIKAALGGKISVVYEPINFRTNWYTGSNPVDSKTHSWILWLSDMPFTKKISFQGTGFHFNKKTGRIEGVYPGSPAADNGLAVGDFILSIDGVPYADYRNGNGGSSTRTVVMTKAKSDERKTVTMPVVELSY